ncbi:sulfite exporter TauE/SafE family protein [Celerinatantimonas yamalensis]|uniref:Probable membrane transporter protein n=1 Tax=Celerinatantimonas yamalensis TaxID=559956 RepID=A0ABW9G381_9GAMM
MIELSINILPIIIITGLIAGFIDAIAGGGGLLTIPALLGIGLPPHLALGTNKLAASFGSSTAAITFYRKQLFKPTLWWRSFVATAVGAVCGAFIVDWVSKAWLDKLLPAIIIGSALYTIVSQRSTHRLYKDDAFIQCHPCKQITQGLALGVYDGFAGPGIGAFWLVSSMALYRLSMLLCAGLAKAMNFTSNFVSLLTFIYLGHVNWLIGLTLGISIMIGAFFGAHSAIRFGEGFIRPIFITVVIILAGKLAWQAGF